MALPCIKENHLGVGAHNLLDFSLDEVVERVNVLLDEALDLEESGQQLPLLLQGRTSTRLISACGLEHLLGEDHD